MSSFPSIRIIGGLGPALVGLCRLSWLPTVWSNCLVGYYLSGARPALHLPFLLAGATLLFLGGALLDHAFRTTPAHETAPPEPESDNGFSQPRVWRWGLGLLVLGIFCLAANGLETALLGLLLAGIIIIHHGFHWFHGLGPALLGLCRLCLYLIAGSSAKSGITGETIWCGVAVGLYAAGSRYLISRNAMTGAGRHWPLLLLGAPLFLGLILNAGKYRENALLLSLVLGLWTLRHVRYAIWMTPANPLRASAGLLSGIVLVDWLAVAHAPRDMGFFFIGCFLAVLVCAKVESLCASPSSSRSSSRSSPPTQKDGA